jgi:hypothetical protein
VRLPRLLAGGAVVAVVTGTAACGVQALEPKIALRDAFSDFTANRSGALELSIASSTDEVLAFAQSADPGSSASVMSDEDLDTLLSSSLDVAYDLGDDRKSETDDSSSVLVRVDDLVAGELRSVGQTLYARADVDGLAKRFPDMQQGLDEARSGLTGGDGVSGPAPAEVVEPATAFLDGKWISVDVAAYLKQLEEMAAGQDGGAAGLDMSDYASDEMRDLLGSALKDAVTSVTRQEEDQIGDHLVAKVDLRKAYTKLRSGLPALFDGEQADVMEQQLPPVSEVPDKQIDVSFWVRDGELKRAELDVAQFVDDAAGSFVLRADVASGRKIAAPDDAVEFDLGALMAAGMSAYQAGDEAYPVDEGDAPVEGDPTMETSEPGWQAEEVAMWIDSDIAQAAAEDGVQPSVSYLPDLVPGYQKMVGDVVVSLDAVAVGERVQVSAEDFDGYQEVVCLTLSAEGTGENIAKGPC